MMGQHKSDPQLFNYAVNLEKRVRAAHPLRRVKATIDFGFVREEVAHCYGKNGNESVAPEVILKMMFLLFFDDIKSERELMEVIGERLDYLWFLDYGLDEKVPDHSVLSKARARWGKEVFESLFVRTVAQCVEAGLVDGSKLHVDASLVDADAAKESVIKGTPELITALKRAYRATECKLEESSTPGTYQAVNDRMMSKSDPDAALVRKGGGNSRPRYQNHRVIDDQKGVVTATETTPGSIAENKKLMTLIDQHQSNTRSQAQTVVADHKYGTAENFVACQPVRSAGLRRTWETRWAKRSTGASERSLAMKLLLTIHWITSIAVPPVKHSSRAECIPFAERSNIRHPPECVRSVFCVLNALALTMDAPCSGTKNKLS
jgi:transposase